MSAAGEARAAAAATAMRKALIAVEWLGDARESALEPNGDAAYLRRCQHARQKLAEALALLPPPPASIDVRASAVAIARAGAAR